MIISSSSWEEETETVAKALPGCCLVHLNEEMSTTGRIVELKPASVRAQLLILSQPHDRRVKGS